MRRNISIIGSSLWFGQKVCQLDWSECIA